MSYTDTRFVWRKVFRAFEIGDRVRIIDSTWLYYGLVGSIAGKFIYDDNVYYSVYLTRKVLNKFGIPDSFEEKVGWFKAEGLEYVGEKGRSVYKKVKKGTVLNIVIGKKCKLGRVIK